MSITFVDELPLLGIETSCIVPNKLSDIPPMKLRNFPERSSILQPVGILPLDHFIYILIGVLVFLCCSFALWAILKAIRSPRRYFKTMEPEANAYVASPYREKRPPAPRRVNAMARDEVRKLRTEPKYQGDGYLEASLAAKPNLPLPVVVEIASPEEPGSGGNARDTEAWGNLVIENESLKVTIANLGRLAQIRQQAGGQQGPINARLFAAIQRRAEVQNSINATYESFKKRRTDWSAEEWQVMEMIMQLSPA